MHEVVNESVFLHSNDLSSKNIKIDVAEVERNVFVHVGKSSVLQVFFNIINNSIQEVVKLEERWIKIEVKNSDKIAYIRIIDSGNGIAPHVAAKMMEPFYTTREIGDGSGLGLSVAKRSLSQYGGDLKYLPDKEHTTFQIEIPCQIREPDEGDLIAFKKAD